MTSFLEFIEYKRMIELTAGRLNISMNDLAEALDKNGLGLVVLNKQKWTNTIAETFIEPPPFSEERT